MLCFNKWKPKVSTSPKSFLTQTLTSKKTRKHFNPFLEIYAQEGQRGTQNWQTFAEETTNISDEIQKHLPETILNPSEATKIIKDNKLT